jgi:hypothetical protein
MAMIRYVTYDEDGNLTGCYIQELQPEHEHNYILFPEELVGVFVYYRANAARDGVEWNPIYPPFNDPSPQPPIDPVPTDPVQSGD